MSYLVNLAIEGRPAVVIGAGRVAERKIQDLVAAQARVTVVALQARPNVAKLAEEAKIALHLRPYAEDDLSGAFVAIAATGDEELHRRIAGDAAKWRVLLNVVDRPSLCTFTVPATVHRGDLTLAVATQGRSPAFSGILREELEEHYGAEYAGVVSLFGELREAMIVRGWDGPSIRTALSAIYRDGVAAVIAAADRKRLRDLLSVHLGAEFSWPAE